MKFDLGIMRDALPLAIELVAITLVFILLGYFIGGMVNKMFSVVCMFIGVTVGLGFFVWRITKRFQ